MKLKWANEIKKEEWGLNRPMNLKSAHEVKNSPMNLKWGNEVKNWQMKLIWTFIRKNKSCMKWIIKKLHDFSYDENMANFEAFL